jgi:putative PEP-CTERM system TPR-repeat lipoprotein
MVFAAPARLILALLFATVPLGCGESDQSLVTSARSALDKQDAAAAIVHLKVILERNPKSGVARLLFGKALLASGEVDAAFEELRKAKGLGVSADEFAPVMARALLARGEAKSLIDQFEATALVDKGAAADLATSLSAAYLTMEDSRKAAEQAARALEFVPRYAPALLMQARLKLAEKDLDRGLALLDEALLSDPRFETAALLKSMVLLAGRRDADGALAVLRKLLVDQPASVPARVALIGVLRQKGDLAAARNQLAELGKAAPNHAETLYLQAQQKFDDGQFGDALEICDRLLKAIPDNPRVLLLAGAIEHRQRAYQKAEAHLSKVLKQVPAHLTARQMLAQTYLRKGEPAKAVDVLQQVTESAQADGASLALVGEAHLAMGNARQADEAFKRAAAVAPADPRVRSALALGQLARGQTSAAIGQLESLAATDKGTRNDLALITAHIRAGDKKSALRAVDALAKKIPDGPLPDLLRGRILQSQQDLVGARAAFEKAHGKDPKYFAAVADLAALDIAQGQSSQAKKRFAAMIKSDPTNHQAHVALAELALREGAPPEEIGKALKAAVAADPRQPQPRLLLIELHLRDGDPNGALNTAQEAVAALPDNVAVQDALGRAQVASGDSQQALSTFGRLVAQQPRNAMMHLRLAEAYMAAQDLNSARGALDRAIALHPGLLQAKSALATIAVRQGRIADALSLAREIQKAEPRNPIGFALEGEVQLIRKDTASAIAAHRAALGVARSTEGAARLHRTYLAAGQPAAADRLAADWRKERPADTAFVIYLGEVAMSKKAWAEAEEQFSTVLKVQPNNVAALNNVAWLMVQQGKPGAVEVAQRANRLRPGRAAMLDTLAAALAAENQLPLAISTQKDAIERSPRDHALRLNLARLYIRSGERRLALTELEKLERSGERFAGEAEARQLLAELR